MRDFLLIRDVDVTGCSGTGIVAEGTVFKDGQTVLKWLREPFALGIYSSLEELIALHSHGGNTYVAFTEQGTFAGN